jgi:hypothetical protein
MEVSYRVPETHDLDLDLDLDLDRALGLALPVPFPFPFPVPKPLQLSRRTISSTAPAMPNREVSTASSAWA